MTHSESNQAQIAPNLSPSQRQYMALTTDTTDVWTVYEDFWKWCQVTFGKGTTEKMYDVLTDGDDPHLALYQFIQHVGSQHDAPQVTTDTTAPITDEELRQLFIQEQERAFFGGEKWVTIDESIDAGIRAVRAALQPAPVVPDGWTLGLLHWHTTEKQYDCELYNWNVDPPLGAFGDHPTDPMAALREAIEEAEVTR